MGKGDLDRYCLALSSHLSGIKLPVCALSCNGEVNANRIRIKLKYKNAIKLAAANSDTVFNNELYDLLCKKDTNGF